MNLGAIQIALLAGILIPLSLIASQASAAEPPELHFVGTSQGQLAYWDEGQGDEVIFLIHGLPTSKTLWRDVMPILAERYRVITLDLPNFGDSEKLDKRLDHPARAQGIDEVRASLEVESLILVSHDLGSSVAMDYLEAYGERVTDVVLMSNPVYPDFEEPGVVELARRPVLGRLLLRLFPRTMYRISMKNGLTHDEKVDRSLVRDFADDYRGAKGKRALYDNLWWGTPETSFAGYPQVMRGLDMPALIVHGADDPYIPLEHEERMVGDIAGSRLVVLEDAAHFIPLDAPEAVAEAVLSFLAERR